MGMQVKDPDTGQLVPLRDVELVQNFNRLNTSVQNISTNLNSIAIDLESLKTQFKSAIGQSVDMLDDINGEIV